MKIKLPVKITQCDRKSEQILQTPGGTDNRPASRDYKKTFLQGWKNLDLAAPNTAARQSISTKQTC